jgi:peptide/nickel transport system substrate-binding protein
MIKLHVPLRRMIVAGAALAAALVFSLSLASASGRATVTHLVIGNTLATSSLDPSVVASFWGNNSMGLETLLKVAPNGELTPNLAVKVTRPGPNVYVYHLRRGVKFWDGAEMTATDVANSLNYARRPAFGNVLFPTTVKSIKAISRYKVAVTLKRTDASWAYAPASTGFIFEKKYQDEHKKDHGKPGVLVMGTGAYKFVSLDPTRGLELVANPNWWGGKPTYQRVSVKYFADEQSEALALRAGDIDFAWVQGDPRAFEATSGTKILTRSSGVVFFFAMNTKEKPWNDIHVRRAVAYAINRADINAAGVGGLGTYSDSIIPTPLLRTVASQSQITTLFKSLPKYHFNLDKARQELAKSAYPNGFSEDLNTVEYGTWVQTNQAIAGDLAKIGINLNVKVLPYNDFLDNWTNLRFHCEFDGTGAVSPDPSVSVNYLLDSSRVRTGGFNFAHYTNPAMDAALRAGISSSAPAKRFAAYSKVIRIAAADVPYVVLYQSPVIIALSKRVTYPTFNSFSNFYVTPVQMELKPK